MSHEHYFRIESNLKNDIVDVKDGEFIYGHDSWIIWFKEYHYQHQIQQHVKDWKKEINTYEDLCDFISWLNKKGIKCDTIPKIYYIENNGEQVE